MTHEEAKGQGKEKPAPNCSLLVLGIGNILLSDEGVGVRVIEAMKVMTLPDNVELLDGGTGTLDLLDILAGRDRIIVIDAVKGGSEPGAVYRFTPADLATANLTPLTAHQVGLLEVLSIAELTGDMPVNIVIFGIEPKILDWGLELSPEVAAVIPKVIELIIKELGV
jgi:hydrogenase maturation protease